MKDAWLKCKVEKGMFSHEVVVKLRAKDGTAVAYLVPRTAEKKDRVLVRVRKQRGTQMAILPTPEPFNPIPVREEDLVPV